MRKLWQSIKALTHLQHFKLFCRKLLFPQLCQVCMGIRSVVIWVQSAYCKQLDASVIGHTWPAIFTSFTSACHVKHGVPQFHMKEPIQAERPFQMITVDITELPVTRQGNRYALVVMWPPPHQVLQQLMLRTLPHVCHMLSWMQLRRLSMTRKWCFTLTSQETFPDGRARLWSCKSAHGHGLFTIIDYKAYKVSQLPLPADADTSVTLTPSLTALSGALPFRPPTPPQVYLPEQAGKPLPAPISTAQCSAPTSPHPPSLSPVPLPRLMDFPHLFRSPWMSHPVVDAYLGSHSGTRTLSLDGFLVGLWQTLRCCVYYCWG